MQHLEDVAHFAPRRPYSALLGIARRAVVVQIVVVPRSYTLLVLGMIIRVGDSVGRGSTPANLGPVYNSDEHHAR